MENFLDFFDDTIGELSFFCVRILGLNSNAILATDTRRERVPFNAVLLRDYQTQLFRHECKM